MDSHTPLTASEIERLWALSRNSFGAPQEVLDAHRLAEYTAAMPRLLSMLTPPTDAALREAVEAAQTGIAIADETSQLMAGIYKRHLHTLLRAVQAPRLGVEQMGAVKAHCQWLLASGFMDEYYDFRAAFPGACEEG